MSKRPNVLFMISDDHRFDAVHAFGTPVVRTPTLDSLVTRGVAFESAYIWGGLTGAVCVPSRACMLTGANAFRSSLGTDMKNPKSLSTINPSMPLLPAELRESGYHTYAIGKWHNDKQSFKRAFSDGAKLFFGGMSDHWQVPVHDFDPSGEYPESARYTGDKHSSELFGDAAVRFLESYYGDDPFFLYVAFTAPHDPRTAPPDFASLYSPADIPLPESYLPEHPFDNGEMRNRDEKLASWPRTPEEVRQHIADYYAMITHLDSRIGRVLEALERRGDAENTIIVYTADHGLAVGRHGLMGKQNVYDHSVHVPLIVAGPGLPKGRRVGELVYSNDVNPTIYELTDTPVPDSMDAQSLLSVVQGVEAHPRESVYSAYKDVQRMVYDGRWKLIRYYRSADGRSGSDRVQLFDLASDPWEVSDLSGDEANSERLRVLAERLEQWRQLAHDPLSHVPVLLSKS